MIVLTILLAWLLADLLSGLAHWFEDVCLSGHYRNRLLNKIVFENQLHHKLPGYMLRFSLFENINTSAVLTLPIAGMLLWFGAPLVFPLAFFFLTFANIIHRWAHCPRKKPLIRVLQTTGLFLSPEQHWRHHRSSKGLGLIENAQADKCFCAMTSWLNPILDRVGFFQLMTKIFVKKRC